MEVYVTEEEQVESLKKWWRENWRSILGGIVLGLAIVFGWRAWVGYKNSVAAQASMHFEQLMGALQRGDYTTVTQQADTLRKEFGTSSYAALAALAGATAKTEQGDLGAARTQLEWALANLKDPGLQHVARLRLARVLLAAGDLGAAEQAVQVGDKGSFVGEYAELEGDIARAKSHWDAARKAYALALQSNVSNPGLVQMKLDNLIPDAKTPQ